MTRGLEVVTPVSVAQLRLAIEPIDAREGRALPHLIAQVLFCLDMDLTGLPAGRRADASTQGDGSGEKAAVVASSPASVPRRTMNAWSPWYIPATRPVRPVCAPPWPPWSECWACRRCSGDGTMLCLDGGVGPDANLTWALWQGYQVLAKGYIGTRAQACARAVPRWEERRPGERWIAPAPPPLRSDRRTRTAVLQWKTAQDRYGHRLLTTSWLDYSLAALAEADDARAALEAAIKASWAASRCIGGASSGWPPRRPSSC